MAFNKTKAIFDAFVNAFYYKFMIEVATMLDIEDWQDLANCKDSDPDLFFPKAETVRAAAAAKRICASCEVAQACLEFVMQTYQPIGIWGGTTSVERKRLRREARLSSI